MVQFAPFIILMATLLINTHSNCSAENVYCVTPTAMSCSSCPQNYSYCATLSEYAQQAELYFTSNTTMVFLSGDHILDIDITVTRVVRLTMHKQFSSGMQCSTNCLQWFSWPQLHKYGRFQTLFFSIYLL